MSPQRKHLLKAVLSFACFSLLAWMVWEANPVQLWQTLCSMPGTIACCVLVWGVGYLLNAGAFSQVLGGTAAGLGYPFVLRLTISGYALNYVTPFGLLGGEPYRVWALKSRIGTEKATQGVVLYSMMHIASHFCFWILAAFVTLIWVKGIARQEGIGLRETLWIAGLILLCLGLLVLFMRLYRKGIALRFMRRWVDWPLLNPSLLPPGRFVRALGLEFLSRLVNVIEYWLIMQALGYTQFGYAEALLVVAFSSLLANILFFSPLQMGTREGGILLALGYLLPGDLLPVAITLSFATRIREFIWIAMGLAFIKRK